MTAKVLFICYISSYLKWAKLVTVTCCLHLSISQYLYFCTTTDKLHGDAWNSTRCQIHGRRKQNTGTLQSWHNIPESVWAPESEELSSNPEAIRYRLSDKFLNCSVLCFFLNETGEPVLMMPDGVREFYVKRSWLLLVHSRYLIAEWVIRMVVEFSMVSWSHWIALTDMRTGDS